MWHNDKIFYRKIPLPVKIKKPVLALGSQAKNTLCFADGDTAYISQIHADLNNLKDYLVFEKDLKRLLKKNPRIIAYDSHPEYQSSKYALNLRATSYELRAIQHHHAHIAACMVENAMKNQKVIGVAFDGTGLGSDNQLWGAEFLVCDYKNFTRRAHLKEIPLLGAEKAILEPWRLAAFWLYLIYKNKFLDIGIDFTKGLDRKKWRVLKNMYLCGLNSPLASSMGRLFDAVASLVLARYKIDFEAELAIELEKLAISFQPSAFGFQSSEEGYGFNIVKNNDLYILDPIVMFKEIIQDLKTGQPSGKIAYRFHFSVAKMIADVCLLLRQGTGLNKIVLSGGVFQNSLLLRLSLGLLCEKGFVVFTHKYLTCNDANISLGQAVIACARSN